MAKCKTLKLKHSEIEYLIELVRTNKDEGTYWGRKDYFQSRQNTVLGKLEHVHNTKAPE